MRALMVPALAAAASGRASSTSAIAAPVPPPVVRRTRRVQTNTVLPPASLSLARREPAPLPGPSDAAVGGKEKARLPRETREIPQRSPSEKQGAQDSAKKRRPRSVGAAGGRARTARQTEERSKSWAALSSSEDSAKSFLSPAEEKALATQIKELQRIESVREQLREEASRSLIKRTETASALDRPAIPRDIEPKPVELARACGLSPAELVAAVEAGKRAREQLVRKNMPLVAQLAMQGAKGKVAIDDLVQEGAKGLLRAAELFDPRKGHRFTTYAYQWIFVHVNRACQNYGRTIRVPVSIYEKLPALVRAKTELSNSLGRPPSHEEVAARMGKPVAEIELLERAFATEESLDVALQISRGFKSGGRTVTLEEALVAPNAQKAAEADVETDIFLADLRSLLGTLLPKERYVLSQYFGVGGAQPRSFAEQAKDIGVSVKVVERLAQSGLEKLRHPSRAAYLLPFLDTSAVAGDGMGDDD